MKKKQVFNFNKANWDLFKQAHPSSYPPDIINNVELMNEFLIKKLLSETEFSIPRKNLKINNNRGLPDYILVLTEQRKVYKKLFRKEKLGEYRYKFNLLTKTIREEINSFKETECKQVLLEQGSNPFNTKPFRHRIDSIRKKTNSKYFYSIFKIR